MSPSAHLRGGDENAHLTGLNCKENLDQQRTRHVSMVHIFCDKEACKDSFTFTFAAGPSLKFTFDIPAPVDIPTNRPFKRRRALSDVDGDGNEGRKKRRLRLQFITSRLSRPFSQPASNIVERGGSLPALFGARNKTLGKNILRKAAIMNRVRIRMDAAKEFMRLEQEKSRERLLLKEIVVPKTRVHDYFPPSPLGLSNYDALDLEDNMLDDDHDEEGIAGISTIYSDFSIMNPDTSDGKDDGFDYLDALDGISSKDLPERVPSPPNVEGIAEVLREDFKESSYFFSYAD